MKAAKLTDVLGHVSDAFRSIGYEKARNRFWRVKDDTYQLIDFQPGAHGNYFFVNVCVHPVGFPKILSGKLIIPVRPLEYECVIRQRIEEVGGAPVVDLFRNSLVPINDLAAMSMIKEAVASDVEVWMGRWGTCEAIALADSADLRMMTLLRVWSGADAS